MACILAAVLFGAQRQDPREVDGFEQELTKTEPQLALVRARLDGARREIKSIIRSYGEVSDLAAENGRLDQRIKALNEVIRKQEKNVTESQQKAALRKKIEKQEQEIATVAEAVARLKEQKSDIDNRIELAGLDDFPRPYVAIECKERLAVVYVPGVEPQPVTLPLPEEKRVGIRGRIAGVAGLVVFVRAAGFHTTYPKVLEEIDGIVRRDADGKIVTALSFVPVQDFEDIAVHILLGGGS